MLLDYITETKNEDADVARERLSQFTGALTIPEANEKAMLEAVVKRAELPVANIDLFSILSMRRPDGLPRWAIVNPSTEVTARNGGVWRTKLLSRAHTEFVVYHGTRRNPGDYSSNFDIIDIASKKNVYATGRYVSERGRSVHVPVGGFPPLPVRIRDLICRCRDFATVAVLYQPIAWNTFVVKRPDPDPALLVRKTLDHPFQVVAVWGHDGPLIKEFSV